MKYISEESVLNAITELKKHADGKKLNKFLGLLELIGNSNCPHHNSIKPLTEYVIPQADLSESLQSHYHLSTNNRAFSSQNNLYLTLPLEWAERIFEHFLGSRTLPIESIAIILTYENKYDDQLNQIGRAHV